jgi:hypothetical protein
MELLATWVPVCHNCAARITGLLPLPRSIAGIQAALGRERRASADTRVEHGERRDGDRRTRARGTGSVVAASDAATGPIDDGMILDIVELAGDLEALAGDLTSIRLAPSR